MLPGAGTDDRLHAIGERLRAAVAGTPIETVDRADHESTISVGGASTADGLDDADALVDAADQALYAAKRRGRDQVRTFATLSQRDREEAAPRIVRLARGPGADGVRARGHAAAALPPGVGARRRGRGRARPAAPRRGALPGRGAGCTTSARWRSPTRILRKTGPLDADEMETMRAHAVIGDQLVRQVQELADAAPGVRHHHERWDGTGYPDGLARRRDPDRGAHRRRRRRVQRDDDRARLPPADGAPRRRSPSCSARRAPTSTRPSSRRWSACSSAGSASSTARRSARSTRRSRLPRAAPRRCRARGRRRRA